VRARPGGRCRGCGWSACARSPHRPPSLTPVTPDSISHPSVDLVLVRHPRTTPPGPFECTPRAATPP
jgi:hypothetical protein